MAGIRVGIRVSARVGPLLDPPLKEGGRRRRLVYIGLVIASNPGNQWTVYWFNIARCSVHSHKTLKVLDHLPPVPCLKPSHVNAIIEERLIDNPGKYKEKVQVGEEDVVELPNPFDLDIDETQTLVSRPSQIGVHTQTQTQETIYNLQETQPTQTQQTQDTATVLPNSAPTIPLAQEFGSESPLLETPYRMNFEEDSIDTMECGPEPDPDQDRVEEKLYSPDAVFLDEEETASLLTRESRAKLDKAVLLDSKVTMRVKNKPSLDLTWRVRLDVKEDFDLEEFHDIGIRGFNFEYHPHSSGRRNCRSRIDFMQLLIHLWPGDWKLQLKRLNKLIRDHNFEQSQVGSRTSRNSSKVMKMISESEFWVFWGLVFVARVWGRRGEVWDRDEPEGVEPFCDYSEYMTKQRHSEIRSWMPFLFQDESKKKTDPWWKIVKAIEEFNENRKKTVRASMIKVMDELMSAFCPQTREFGDLPHLTFILRKPEPLGTEFKAVCCSKTGVLLWLELQRGEEGMAKAKYAKELKATSACVMRLIEGSRRDSNRGVNGEECDIPKQTFLGDSWFASVEAATEAGKRGEHFIGIIKTGHSRYPKKYIESKMKNWPAGSHIVMETTNDGVDLLAVGYKYNKWKVICFIATKGAGHTKPGKPYEARWKDSNNNTCSRDIPRPELVSKYFERCNAVDKHNQSRQFNLKLEKHWITTCGYFRIITSLIGICVTDAWKGYKHHLSDRHHHKNITIAQFTSILAKDCLNNPFNKQSPSNISFSIEVEDRGASQRTPAEITIERLIEENRGDQSVVSALTHMYSSKSSSKSSNKETGRVPLQELSQRDLSQIALDKHLETHKLVQNNEYRAEKRKRVEDGEEDEKNVTRRCIRGICKYCKKRSKWHCPRCVPAIGAKKAWVCNPETSGSYCHRKHLQDVEAAYFGEP